MFLTRGMVYGSKPSLCWVVSEEAKNQESTKLDGGVPFPSPKIAQNEHFYIVLVTCN